MVHKKAPKLELWGFFFISRPPQRRKLIMNQISNHLLILISKNATILLISALHPDGLKCPHGIAPSAMVACDRR